METNIAFSGTIPETYDKYLGPLLFEPYAKDIIERIKKKKFLNVLELACGTGRVTQYLRDILPADARIVATDINPDMLNIAQNKITGKNIEWKEADMQNIPFKDSEFDLVICQFGIMFVPDKEKAYSEIYRVLKKDGMFLFNTWNKLEKNRLLFSADEIINDYFKDNPVLFYQIPFSYFKIDEIEKHLTEAGFSSFQITELETEGLSDSVSDATTGMVEGNPVLSAINEKDPKLIPVIKEKLSNVLSEKFGDNPLRCPMHAIVCEAIK